MAFNFTVKSHPLLPDSDGSDSESDFLSVNSSEQGFELENISTKDSSSISRSPSSPSSTTSSTATSKNKHLFPVSDIVEDLRPEEVRWFYKGPSDKKWTAFIGYDSLRIECKYREMKHQCNKNVFSVPESDNEKICVRGSLYEVDVKEQKCYPIYWHRQDQTADIIRGLWFYDAVFQPLEQEYALEIESFHLKHFLHQKIPPTIEDNLKAPLKVLQSLKFKDFAVEWNAPNMVFLHYQSTSSKLKRAILHTKLMGYAQAGTRLHRGYCYEACMDDKPPEIGHLVFVVHGIGQKMDMGSIVTRCGELRSVYDKMLEKHMKDMDWELEKRAEFLPVEWRSSLKLDGDIVDSITPSHFVKLRSLLNSSAMDILYYTSPLYRAEITQGLQSELNRLYSMFCERTPYFEASGGKVSIVAHSLGSVIMYDIVTGWNPIQLYDQYASAVIKSESQTEPVDDDQDQKGAELGCSGKDLLQQLDDARKTVSKLENELFQLAAARHPKTPTLNFKLENIFMLGSPLSVFLALRGIRSQGSGDLQHIMPKHLCSRIYNIYHPYDPVAYRLEPLILKHYCSIMPLKVYRYDVPLKDRLSYASLPNVPYSQNKMASKAKAEGRSKETNNNDNKGGGGSGGTQAAKKEKKKDQETGRSWGSWLVGGKSKKPVSEMRVMAVKERDGGASSPERGASGQSDVDTEGETCSGVTNGLTGSVTPEESDDLDTHDLKLFLKSDITTEQPELEHRVDFQLHKGKMSSAYWGALTSHTSYWTNSDVALFFLQHLYPQQFIQDTKDKEGTGQ